MVLPFTATRPQPSPPPPPAPFIASQMALILPAFVSTNPGSPAFHPPNPHAALFPPPRSRRHPPPPTNHYSPLPALNRASFRPTPTSLSPHTGADAMYQYADVPDLAPRGSAAWDSGRQRNPDRGWGRSGRTGALAGEGGDRWTPAIAWEVGGGWRRSEPWWRRSRVRWREVLDDWSGSRGRHGGGWDLVEEHGRLRSEERESLLVQGATRARRLPAAARVADFSLGRKPTWRSLWAEPKYQACFMPGLKRSIHTGWRERAAALCPCWHGPPSVRIVQHTGPSAWMSADIQGSGWR